MPEPLFEPIPIRYTGLYADQHFVDAQQFGKSLINASKIANSICHLFISREITHDPRSYGIRFFVGPLRENGYVQDLFAIANSGTLPVYPDIFFALAKVFIENVFDAVLKRAAGRHSESEAVIETLRHTIDRMADSNDKLLDGNLQNQRWLQNMVSSLTFEERAPLRDISDPVGKSVSAMSIGDQPRRFVIDEAAADVLRSKLPLSVGDTGTYRGRFLGVLYNDWGLPISIIGNGQDCNWQDYGP